MRALTLVLDLLFPRSCAGCGRPNAPGALAPWCGGCAATLPWIEPPYCAVCGERFSPAAGSDAPRFAGRTCASCRKHPPPFASARAAFRYEDPVRRSILALKFAGRRDLAVPLGRCMAEAAVRYQGFLSGVAIVVPVPLHAARLRERGFNQSEELSRALGEALGLAVEPAALSRPRDTEPQVGLDRARRAANLAGAFAASPERGLDRAIVLLVDDVMTTGATARAAAAALLRGGAREVRVLTLARD